MAHECPECWHNCHCGGDIEDMNYGYNANCTHCDCKRCHQTLEHCICDETDMDIE